MRLDVSESSAVLCINDMQGRRITILPVLVHTFHAVGRTYGQPYNDNNRHNHQHDDSAQ